MDNGPKKIMEMAEAAGAPKGAGWDANSRLPLGTAEVSPLAQASAYATFANDGVAVPDHVVREVRDAKGKIIYKAAVRGEAGGQQPTSPPTSPTRCPASSTAAPAGPPSR